MALARFGVCRSQHTGQLENPLVAVQTIYTHLCGSVFGLFDDPELIIGARGNLGEVGYTERLSSLAGLLQEPAYRMRGFAADPGIDFIENPDPPFGAFGCPDNHGKAES